MIKLIEEILENENLLDFILSEGCIVLSMYDPYETTTLGSKLYKVDLKGVEDLQGLQRKLIAFINDNNTSKLLEYEKTLELFSNVLLPLHKELVDKCDTRIHIISKSYYFFSPIDGDRVECLNTFDFVDRIVKLYNRNFKFRDYDCSWISN